MTASLSLFLSHCLKAGAVLLVVNEVRGFILAGPVLYAIYEAGGSIMAIWVGFCSLCGIALTVTVPLLAARRLRRVLPTQSG
jgi:hypothetical protein